jgi:hypothetical protein
VLGPSRATGADWLARDRAPSLGDGVFHVRGVTKVYRMGKPRSMRSGASTLISTPASLWICWCLREAETQRC